MSSSDRDVVLANQQMAASLAATGDCDHLYEGSHADGELLPPDPNKPAPLKPHPLRRKTDIKGDLVDADVREVMPAGVVKAVARYAAAAEAVQLPTVGCIVDCWA